MRAESALIKRKKIEIKNIAKFLPPFLSMHRGLGARIAGFHPAGPGSIPGVGELFLKFFSRVKRTVNLI